LAQAAPVSIHDKNIEAFGGFALEGDFCAVWRPVRGKETLSQDGLVFAGDFHQGQLPVLAGVGKQLAIGRERAVIENQRNFVRAIQVDDEQGRVGGVRAART
jgi:hypothetical protein